MKKITIAILMLLGTYSNASAELGMNVGVSGQMGVFTGQGHETMGTVDKKGAETAMAVFGYASIFVEKDLGQYLTLGIDFVPDSMSSETEERIRDTKFGDATSVTTNNVKVDFEDMITAYAAVNVTENFYVKAGLVEVDVITKESLGTGGAYPNTSMDGTMLGMGYNKDLTNGMFVRAEGTYMDFDNIKLSSNAGETKFITVSSLAGLSGKISVGKSF